MMVAAIVSAGVETNGWVLASTTQGASTLICHAVLSARLRERIDVL